MDDQSGMDALQFLLGLIVTGQIGNPGVPGGQINRYGGKVIKQTRRNSRERISAGVVWRFAKLGSLCPICDIFVPQRRQWETHRNRWVILKKSTNTLI